MAGRGLLRLTKAPESKQGSSIRSASAAGDPGGYSTQAQDSTSPAALSAVRRMGWNFWILTQVVSHSNETTSSMAAAQSIPEDRAEPNRDPPAFFQQLLLNLSPFGKRSKWFGELLLHSLTAFPDLCFVPHSQVWMTSLHRRSSDHNSNGFWTHCGTHWFTIRSAAVLF